MLVKTGPGFLDNEWFKGARLNYAENMLRVRDDRIALICLGTEIYLLTVIYIFKILFAKTSSDNLRRRQ